MTCKTRRFYTACSSQALSTNLTQQTSCGTESIRPAHSGHEIVKISSLGHFLTPDTRMHSLSVTDHMVSNTNQICSHKSPSSITAVDNFFLEEKTLLHIYANGGSFTCGGAKFSKFEIFRFLHFQKRGSSLMLFYISFYIHLLLSILFKLDMTGVSSFQLYT